MKGLLDGIGGGGRWFGGTIVAERILCMWKYNGEIKTKQLSFYILGYSVCFSSSRLFVLKLLTIPFFRTMTLFSSRSYDYMNESRLSPITTRFVWMWYARCFYPPKKNHYTMNPVDKFGPYIFGWHSTSVWKVLWRNMVSFHQYTCWLVDSLLQPINIIMALQRSYPTTSLDLAICAEAGNYTRLGKVRMRHKNVQILTVTEGQGQKRSLAICMIFYNIIYVTVTLIKLE